MRLVCVLILAVLTSSPVAAGEPVDLLSAVPGQPTSGSDLTVLPTAEGLLAAWWNPPEGGLPVCPSGCPVVARFDADGSALGDARAVTIDPLWQMYGGPFHLRAVQNGFLLFAEQTVSVLYAVPLDPEGDQRGPSHVVRQALELHRASFAGHGADVLTVYPEWLGCFHVWSHGVGPDGRPYDDRAIVGPLLVDRTDCLTGGIYRAPVVTHGPGYLAAWADTDLGVFVRELDRRGRPAGDAVQVRPPGRCTRIVSVESIDRKPYVFDSSGCEQQDLHVTIPGSGLTLPVAADPDRDEGHDGYRRGLSTAALGNRIGVVYVDRRAGSRHEDERWWFVEIDDRGRSLGPPLDLSTTFGMNPVDTDDAGVVADLHRARYLVHWSGDSSSGRGLWVLPVETAP